VFLNKKILLKNIIYQNTKHTLNSNTVANSFSMPRKHNKQVKIIPFKFNYFNFFSWPSIYIHVFFANNETGFFIIKKIKTAIHYWLFPYFFFLKISLCILNVSLIGSLSGNATQPSMIANTCRFLVAAYLPSIFFFFFFFFFWYSWVSGSAYAHLD